MSSKKRCFQCDFFRTTLGNNATAGRDYLYPTSQRRNQQFNNPAHEGGRIRLDQHAGRSLLHLGLRTERCSHLHSKQRVTRKTQVSTQVFRVFFFARRAMSYRAAPPNALAGGVYPHAWLLSFKPLDNSPRSVIMRYRKGRCHKTVSPVYQSVSKLY